MTIELSPTDVRSLCGGAVAVPGDDAYEAGRGAWNVAVDQRPALVAYPANAVETAEVMRYARDAGLRVAPQSTGHNAAPLSDLSNTVLLKTAAMTHVEIDAERQIARVGGGVLWEDVVDAAAKFELYPLHGSSPDVAVAGYSLGGGMGWLARKHGLQTNSLLAVEIVTPDGEIVHANAVENAELFWAIRGGGGNFGVVTELAFRLYPYRDAYAGWMVWDWAQSERVLNGWIAWSKTAPDEVTTSIRILQTPDIEDVPEPLRGKQIIAIDGAVAGLGEAAAADVVAPLRAMGPDIDTFATIPAAALVRLHGDPEGPTPVTSDTMVVGELDEVAIQALVGVAGPGSNSPLMMVELRQLGGALGRPAVGSGALSHLDGEFVLFAGGLAITTEIEAVSSTAARRVMQTMTPWSNGRQYLNFAETEVDPSAGFGAETYARLRAVRETYDPDNRMHANHEID
jgi:FAD/FMN-containing dehydrogenase